MRVRTHLSRLLCISSYRDDATTAIPTSTSTINTTKHYNTPSTTLPTAYCPAAALPTAQTRRC